MNNDPFSAITGQASPHEGGPREADPAQSPSAESFDELVAAREALEESRRQWELEIRRKQEEFKSMATELARQRGELDAHRAASDAVPPAPEAPAFRPVQGDAPLDAATVLAKVYGANPLESGETPDRGPSPIRPGRAAAGPLDRTGHRPASLAAQKPPLPELPTAEDEESLQQYMAEMMKRVRGESGPLPTVAHQRPAPPPAPAVKPQPIEAIQPAAHFHPERLEELPQRKLPPEMTSDLSAMRALANRSAQTALDSHTRNRWLQAGWGKATVALCGLLSGLLLSYWSGHLGSYCVIAAGLGYMVFLFWGLQAMIILSYAYKTNFSTGGEAHARAAETTGDPSLAAPPRS